MCMCVMDDCCIIIYILHTALSVCVYVCIYYALTPFLFVQRDKLFPALGFGGKIGEQVRYL